MLECNDILSYILPHIEVSPSHGSIGANVLVELETCVGPQVKSRPRRCGSVSHGSHQTHARNLKYLNIE